MKYEVTVLVSVHPQADFAGTGDEMENVYSLIEASILDVDDLTIDNLEVLEQG